MKQPPSPPPPASQPPRAKPSSAPIDLSQESVAGEEDPGAALDLGLVELVAPPAPRAAPGKRRTPKRR
jgi:hypothetical protein